jgi:hypothetical protein
MLDEGLPELAFKYKPLEKQSRWHPKRHGKTSSWERVEEYRLNKPN